MDKIKRSPNMKMNWPTYLRTPSSHSPAGKHLFSGILITLLTTMIVGCGFQLRGKLDVPQHLQRLQVQVGDRDFRTQLERQLSLMGIEENDAARYRLHVLRKDNKTDISSFGGSDRASEYKLTTKIRYQLETQDGITLFGPYELQQSRRYMRDPNNYSSSKSEEAQLYSELEQEIISSMIRRISAISQEDLTAAENQVREQREKQERLQSQTEPGDT